ncbi:MAG: adenosylcobinamide-phosphate synthase CbiB, partial [Pseudomonadota bacterium]
MNGGIVLVVGLLLDAALGEPKWIWDRWPHPVVVMGRLIAWADERFNAGRARRLKGGLLVSGLVGLAFTVGHAIEAVLPGVLEAVVVAVLLAQRSLSDHVKGVAHGLRLSLDDGRRMVARIVGRDTRPLDESGVARAAIESAAENLSDGVMAPALWYLLLGLPGMLIYKVVNTADSMIGYRTERHSEFGWAAARLDDVLNWAPARLTALILIGVYARAEAWAVVRRDARLHRSPNAGWPEAATAAIL